MMRQSEASPRELSDVFGRDLPTTTFTGYGFDRRRGGFDVASGDEPLPLSERYSDQQWDSPNDHDTA